jgi:hypothetical protein
MSILDPKLLLLLLWQTPLEEDGSCVRRTWLQIPWLHWTMQHAFLHGSKCHSLASRRLEPYLRFDGGYGGDGDLHYQCKLKI